MLDGAWMRGGRIVPGPADPHSVGAVPAPRTSRDHTTNSGGPVSAHAAPVPRRKRNQMSVVELQELEEVKGLIAKGQRVGVLNVR